MKKIMLKTCLKNEKVRTFSIALLLAIIFLVTHFKESTLLNISNTLFVVAAVYIVVGVFLTS